MAVGIGAGPDDGCIADPAIALVGHAAGGGTGSQMAVAVQRQRADGAEMLGGLQIQLGLRLAVAGLGLERFLQLLPALVGAEIGRVYQGDALLARERFSAVADQHHVLGAVHHAACQQDRVLDRVHAGNRTGLAAGAIHDGRVQFVPAVMGKHRTAASVELRRILQHGDGGGHCIHCTAATLQHRVPGTQCALHRLARLRLLVLRKAGFLHARATMDDQHRRGCKRRAGDEQQKERQA